MDSHSVFVSVDLETLFILCNLFIVTSVSEVTNIFQYIFDRICQAKYSFIVLLQALKICWTVNSISRCSITYDLKNIDIKFVSNLPDSEMGEGADECDAVEWLLDTVEEEHSDTERLLESA